MFYLACPSLKKQWVGGAHITAESQMSDFQSSRSVVLIPPFSCQLDPLRLKQMLDTPCCVHRPVTCLRCGEDSPRYENGCSRWARPSWSPATVTPSTQRVFASRAGDLEQRRPCLGCLPSRVCGHGLALSKNPPLLRLREKKPACCSRALEHAKPSGLFCSLHWATLTIASKILG